LKGGLGELAPVVAGFVGRMLVADAVMALVECALERYDEAAALVDRVAPVLVSHPQDLSWPFAVATTIEAAARAGATRHASTLEGLVAPYRGCFVAYGNFWLGSYSFYLGLLAAMQDRLDEADDLLREAADDEARVPAPPFLARSRLTRAALLRRRGRG